MEYYLAIKKNETMPFAATCMGLVFIMLSEINHTVKDKYHILLLAHEILKKMIQVNLFTNRNRLTDREKTCGYQGGRVGER